MTFCNGVCLFYTRFYVNYNHSLFPFSFNAFFSRGGGGGAGAAQERDFSKPVFPNLLKFGMCLSKWFISEAMEAFCFRVKIVGVSKFLQQKFCENVQIFFSSHITAFKPLPN